MSSVSEGLARIRPERSAAITAFKALLLRDVTDLSVSETTLETVFINLTGKDLRE